LSSKRAVSVVIPTRNEPLIETLLEQVQAELAHEVKDYEIIVVDKSDDNTPGRASKFSARIINQTSTGLGGALREGLRASRGDHVLTMDADLSHDPSQIPALLEASEKFDVVIGSRRIAGGSIEGWGVWRRMVSTVGNAIGRFLAGVDVSDLTSGFRVYRRSVIEAIPLEEIGSSGYAFQMEILWHCRRRGFSVGSVPIVFRDRAAGKSKLRTRDMLDFLLTAVRLRLHSLLKPATV